MIRNVPFGVAFFGSFAAIVATLFVSRRFTRRTTVVLVGLAGVLHLFVLVSHSRSTFR